MQNQAALYDLFYKSMKDYAGEAGDIANLIRRARPDCRTLLDVGCGTGEHARLLGEVHGFEVDGVDLDPSMLAIARTKWPQGRFEIADMKDFHLGRRYDGVLTLFGAIAHALTVSRLRDTLACMREHLVAGGVAIVQPYLTPDEVRVGMAEYTVASGDLRVRRIRRSLADHERQLLHFHFSVEGPGGVQELDEVHDLGLFTVDDMLAAFAAVGLAATYDPGSPPKLGGRGFYIARAPA
jgi:SAM-dependent methyltransferase